MGNHEDFEGSTLGQLSPEGFFAEKKYSHLRPWNSSWRETVFDGIVTVQPALGGGNQYILETPMYKITSYDYI